MTTEFIEQRRRALQVFINRVVGLNAALQKCPIVLTGPVMLRISCNAPHEQLCFSHCPNKFVHQQALSIAQQFLLLCNYGVVTSAVKTYTTVSGS